jgi:hypothetical protein
MQARSGAAFDRVVGNSVNTALTAWIAATTGSPEAAAAIGGMIGPLAEELSFALRRAANFQRTQGEYMLGEAASTSQIPVDALLAELTSDPARLQLLLRALEVAARSATEGKLVLVADLLATGALAKDNAVVDEQMLVVDAVGALESPHFRLLIVLGDPSPVWWDAPAARATFRRAWPEERILQRNPGLTNSLTALAARLQSLGLARDVSRGPSPDPLWELTQFGRICFEAVKKRGVSAFVSQSGTERVD